MPDRVPLPPSSRPALRVPICVIARAPLVQRFVPPPPPQGPPLRMTPSGVERVPLPLPPPKAFEVRIREGLNSCVHVIGHDHAGETMVEVQMQRKHLSSRTVSRVERWCRELDSDANPDLKLV